MGLGALAFWAATIVAYWVGLIGSLFFHAFLPRVCAGFEPSVKILLSHVSLSLP